MKTKTLLSIIVIFCAFSLTAQIVNVPADHSSIQAGIDAATDGDTVLVSDGTYYENINFMGKAIVLASHLLLDNDTSHITNTIIDGSQAADVDSASAVMFISREDTNSVLYGFTIQGGQGLSSPILGYESSRIGGGIACLNSSPKILYNKITNNHVVDSIASFGGGLAVMVEEGEYWMVVMGNSFTNNSCAISDSINGFSASGGGLYISGNATVENNMFYENNCSSPVIAGGGGATFESLSTELLRTVYFNNNDVQYNEIEAGNNIFGAGLHVFDANAYVDGNTISNNTCISKFAVIAAGVNFFQFLFSGATYFTDNIVSDNTASGVQDGWGTGFNISHPTNEVVISGNLFSNNTIAADGIAYGTISIWIYDEGHPAATTSFLIDRNVFEMNDAETGAAIVAFNQFNSEITNNLFYGNNATEFDGGAMLFKRRVAKGSFGQFNPEGHFGKVKLIQDHQGVDQQKEETLSVVVNNTFISNSSFENGGAIASDYISEKLLSFNNLFWDNTAGADGDDVHFYGEGDGIFIAHSLIDENKISGKWAGYGNISDDPVVHPDSIHLEAESPCINQGADSVGPTGVVYYSPEHDFDGDPRPLYGSVDIGADEYFVVGLTQLTEQRADLLNVYPNPVRQTATIEFKQSELEEVKLSIYNSLGELIETLNHQTLPKGNYTFTWQTDRHPQGIYFVRLQSLSKEDTKQMVIIK